MLNLLAITLLAVIVKNPGMMQNINGAIDNYDDVSYFSRDVKISKSPEEKNGFL